MSIEAKQVLDLIIRPTLNLLEMQSLSAQKLMLITGMLETGFDYLKQHPEGPALGWWQMEPATFFHLCSYIRRKKALHQKVLSIIFTDMLLPFEALVWNLRYACILARIQYWQHEEPLPAHTDMNGLASYYLKYYNGGGKGTKARFLEMANQVNDLFLPAKPLILIA